MTVLDDRNLIDEQLAERWHSGSSYGHGKRPVRPSPSSGPRSGRASVPPPVVPGVRLGGPAIAPMRYRGTGIGVSRATHLARRQVSTTVTVALAALAR